MLKTSLPLIRVNSGERAHEKDRLTRMWIVHSPRSLIWLEGIIELKLDQSGVKIFPRMLDGAEVAVIQASADSERQSPHATPLKEVLAGVWIPFDAEPRIPLAHSDLEHLLIMDATVILPNDNCIHLDQSSCLFVKDLLVAPERSSNQWNCARVDEPLRFTIKSLHTPKPLSLDNYLDEVKGEIGTEPLSDLKPKSTGLSKILPKDLMNKSGLAAGGKMIGGAGFISISAVAKLLSMGGGSMSGTGSHVGGAYEPGFLDKLQKWAQGKLENIKAKQETEISKLMDMFENDPDQALKYALPLNGQDGRGLAPPSGSLSLNNVKFDINSITSGGAISPWDIGGDNFYKLNQLYRDAANREIQLGNFDKAAYIFAKLLDDQISAAQVLEQGGKHLEAALLYERNNQEFDAARNFVKAGDFTKALEIYKKHNKLDSVAQLYTQLGREEEANQVWRDEIERLNESGSFVAAAEMMIDKFSESQEAIDLLESKWPNAPQALECLRKEIILREDYQSEDELRERIESLHVEIIGRYNFSDLSAVLGQAYHRASDDEMKAFLEDQIRITSAYSIEDDTDVKSSNLNVLRSINADDDIMIHDLTKVISKHKKSNSIIKSSKYEAKGSKVEAINFVGAAVVPPGLRLVTAAHLPDREVLVVMGGGEVTIIGVIISYNDLKVDRSYEMNINFMKGLDSIERGEMKLLIDKSNKIMCLNGLQSMVQEEFKLSHSGVQDVFTIIGTANEAELSCCSNSVGQIVSLCYKEGSYLYLSIKNGENIISTHHLENLPEDFDKNLIKNEHIQSFVVAVDKAIYFAVGPLLGRFMDNETEWLYIGDNVINMCASPSGAKQRVAVSTKGILLCLWNNLSLQEVVSEPMDRHIETIFLPSGLLVSLVENGQSFSVRRTGFEGNFDQVSHFAVDSSAKKHPKKVIPYGRNKCTICYEDELHVYTIVEAR